MLKPGKLKCQSADSFGQKPGSGIGMLSVGVLPNLLRTDLGANGSNAKDRQVVPFIAGAAADRPQKAKEIRNIAKADFGRPYIRMAAKRALEIHSFSSNAPVGTKSQAPVEQRQNANIAVCRRDVFS
jgi:hypothetical protein